VSRVEICWEHQAGDGTWQALHKLANLRWDGFNLNAVKVSIEKALDEAQWAAGYTFDMIMGLDASAYATTLDRDGGSSSFAIKQAYVALRAPVGSGLDFKVGVFDTIIGYETFDAGSNRNNTHSYTTFQATEKLGLHGPRRIRLY
jgi:hypothetical protein